MPIQRRGREIIPAPHEPDPRSLLDQGYLLRGRPDEVAAVGSVQHPRHRMPGNWIEIEYKQIAGSLHDPSQQRARVLIREVMKDAHHLYEVESAGYVLLRRIEHFELFVGIVTMAQPGSLDEAL